MRSVFPIVSTIGAYAVALIFMGVLTFMAKPPGVSALTAILFPSIGAGVLIVCAVLTTQIHKSQRNARIGVYVAMLVTALLVIGPGMRLSSSLNKNRLYYDAQVEDANPELVDVAPKNPTGYQAVGLGGVAALSFFALIAMIAQRPKWSLFAADGAGAERSEKRKKKGHAADVEESGFKPESAHEARTSSRPLVEREPEEPSDPSPARSEKPLSDSSAHDEIDDLLRRPGSNS